MDPQRPLPCGGRCRQWHLEAGKWKFLPMAPRGLNGSKIPDPFFFSILWIYMCINRCYMFICLAFTFLYFHTCILVPLQLHMHRHFQLPHTFRHSHFYIDMYIYMHTVYCFTYTCFFLMHIVLIYISFHLLIASFQSDDRACHFSKGVHFCSPHLCSVFIKVLFLKFSSFFC